MHRLNHSQLRWTELGLPYSLCWWQWTVCARTCTWWGCCNTHCMSHFDKMSSLRFNSVQFLSVLLAWPWCNGSSNLQSTSAKLKCVLCTSGGVFASFFMWLHHTFLMASLWWRDASKDYDVDGAIKISLLAVVPQSRKFRTLPWSPWNN